MKAEFQVTYFLWKARADKNGLAPVLIRSKQNSDKQIPYNTGVRLHPQQWNVKKKEPKNKPAVLIELERKLKETYQDLVAQGYRPNLDDLLDHIDDRRKPNHKGIIAWCDDFLEAKYSDGQKKAVKTLKTNITGFNKKLTFDQLTKARLKLFFEWLTDQGVANNSQSKRLTALRNVANHANFHIKDLETFELPYSTKNALKVRLTWPEVKAVMNTPVETPKEQVAKDVFLLACFSGLRISDIMTLERGELHDYHYERIQTKGKKPVLVTLHTYNTDLFKKYIGGVPYTRQKLSKELDSVLERSGLTKEVTIIKQVGHEYKETTKKKFEEIGFHSGRRFYARLLTDLGLGGEIKRDELGHDFANVTDLYAGSPDHMYRVARVRKAMETLEETLEQLSLMKVA